MQPQARQVIKLAAIYFGMLEFIIGHEVFFFDIVNLSRRLRRAARRSYLDCFNKCLEGCIIVPVMYLLSHLFFFKFGNVCIMCILRQYHSADSKLPGTSFLFDYWHGLSRLWKCFDSG